MDQVYSYTERRRVESRPNKSSGIFFKLILLLSVPFLVAAYVAWLYTSNISTPLSESSETVYVNIKINESREEIAKKLVDMKILQDETWFIWYTRISKEGNNIQAGNHIIPRNLTIQQLVAKLEEKPDEDTVWITIPEGLRYDEIAEILDKGFTNGTKKKFDKAEFLRIAENPRLGSSLDANVREFLNTNIPSGKSIEGFLYPDTYNLAVDASTTKVMDTLVGTFITRLGKLNQNKLNNSKYSVYQIVNMAAMIERESFNNDESRMIADIIIRRLEGGYFLGIDATLLYPLKDWKANLPPRILNDDTEPYNTRKVMGLPPTPICNPSIVTIEAVLDHKPNNYLYYIHDNDGVIHYAKTNAEHEANVRKYL